MQIFSIYKSMEQSARLCPNDSNIKLVLRHSIRHEIKEGSIANEIELRPEGKILANRMGESINIPIGSISSSFIPRCISTCNEIIDGYNKSHKRIKIQIQKTKLLQEPHIQDHKLAGDTWQKFGSDALHKTIDAFVNKSNLPGMYDLDTSMNRLFNYVFETGNNKGTIDIFCTHDFQMIMLLLFIFGNNNSNMEQLLTPLGYPLMLEGLFLWKNERNITISWRGKIKQL
jgi:broad specificity phosphatase PhoE